MTDYDDFDRRMLEDSLSAVSVRAIDVYDKTSKSASVYINRARSVLRGEMRLELWELRLGAITQLLEACPGAIASAYEFYTARTDPAMPDCDHNDVIDWMAWEYTKLLLAVMREAVKSSARPKGLAGDVDIVSMATESLAGDVDIVSTATESLAGDVDIASTATESLAGDVDIVSTATESLAGDVDIVSTATESLAGDVDIASMATESLAGDVDIVSMATESLDGDVDIVSMATESLDGDVDIVSMATEVGSATRTVTAHRR